MFKRSPALFVAPTTFQCSSGTVNLEYNKKPKNQHGIRPNKSSGNRYGKS